MIKDARLNAAARGYELRATLAAWYPPAERMVVLRPPFLRRTVRLLRHIRRTLKMMGLVA